ncbi:MULTISPECIES: EAL domain-containing protein [unclassified Crossiella]|uniref:EAL domain-containing protein n=1 Tax=unclassified Crossiella TaxID=2620835 RepID=UPI002000147B|nr:MULTISPECIES: EAL domain-containing protein [unclassified Crossiella]MCK2243720.1 EAL domain-containing protein [Crossiella sp. S99.2]MCK2257579.1 EAL domain-containing protein [Crossiella sp. S99.1]
MAGMLQRLLRRIPGTAPLRRRLQFRQGMRHFGQIIRDVPLDRDMMDATLQAVLSTAHTLDTVAAASSPETETEEVLPEHVEPCPQMLESAARAWTVAAASRTYISRDPSEVRTLMSEGAAGLYAALWNPLPSAKARRFGHCLTAELLLTPESVSGVMALVECWLAEVQRSHLLPTAAAGRALGELTRGGLEGARERVFTEQAALVTAMRKAERNALHTTLTQGQSFRTAMTGCRTPMAVLNRRGVIAEVNDAFAGLTLGLNTVGKRVGVLGHTTSDREALHNAMLQALHSPGDAVWTDITLAWPNGQPRARINVGLVFSPLSGLDGEMYMLAKDTSELQTWQHAFQLKFNHNGVADLPNRSRFLALAQHEMSLLTDAATVTLCLVRLENHAAIAEKVGQVAGETLVISAVQRIVAAIGGITTAVMARLDENTFAVLFPISDLWGSVHEAIERITAWTSDPVTVQPGGNQEGTSAGQEVKLLCDPRIATAQGHPRTVSARDLLQQAETELNRLSLADRGANRTRRTTASAESHHHDRYSHLLPGMGEAHETGKLFLDWEKVMDIKRKEMVGVRATVRWEHPEHGSVPADGLVAEAIDLGMAVPLGRWLIEEAALAGGQWYRDFGSKAPFVQLPVPRRLARDEALPELIRNILSATGMPAQQLHLLLPDGASIDDEVTDEEEDEDTTKHPRLEALSLTGAIAGMIGAGKTEEWWSQLPYMMVASAVIPAKITELLGAQGKGAEGRRAPAECLIQLCKRLRHKVTISGVTHHAEVSTGKALKVDWASGPYYGDPLRTEEVPAGISDRVATVTSLHEHMNRRSG